MELTAIESAVRDALTLAFTFSALLLIPSFLLGLASGVFQALTSIQDQVLGFAPKVFVISALLFFSSSWMLSQFQEYVGEVFRLAEVAGASH